MYEPLANGSCSTEINCDRQVRLMNFSPSCFKLLSAAD
jgi:hypothetical protein